MYNSDSNSQKQPNKTRNEQNGRKSLSSTQSLVVSEANSRVDGRINELEKEWDVERTVELNCAVLAIAGTALGVFVHRRWFALPVLAATFLAQNSIQGWNPLIPVFKKFGFRNKKEIHREKYALKALRGDFKRIGGDSDKAYKAVDL